MAATAHVQRLELGPVLEDLGDRLFEGLAVAVVVDRDVWVRRLYTLRILLRSDLHLHLRNSPLHIGLFFQLLAPEVLNCPELEILVVALNGESAVRVWRGAASLHRLE